MKGLVKFLALAIGLTLVAFLLYDSFISPDRIKIDTVYVETVKIDTVVLNDTIYQPGQVVYQPGDTVIVEKVPDSLLYLLSEPIERVRIYNRSFLVPGGLVKIETGVLGFMFDQEISFAKTTQIVKTVTKETTITKRIPQNGVFIGVHVLQGYGIHGNYQFKSGWALGYQYTVVQNNGAHFISVSKKIL